MKPRKPIRKVSARRARQNSIFYRLKKSFLAGHRFCERCGGRSEEVHHSRGKVQGLLIMPQYFKAVCRPCHNWIGDNIEAARKQGLICDKGLWNSP